MNIQSLSLCALVAGATLACCGCASIISGRTATVNIDSNPSDAAVVIHDKHGKEVITTHTPATIELRRKDKFIWPAKYTATIEKPGYKTATVPINQTVNPWVIGNVVVGGVIGLAIDNATGAAWKPKVASIDQQLEPVYVAQQPTAYPAGDSTPLPTYPPEVASRPNVQPATAIY